MEAVNLTVWKWSDSLLEERLLLQHHHGSSPSSSSIIQLFWGAVLLSIANLVFQNLIWKLDSARLPPCPSLWEVVYHFVLQCIVKQRPLEEFFTRIGQNHAGGVIRLSNWGVAAAVPTSFSSQPPAVLISSAAAAHEFFKLHDAQFGARPSYMPKAMWGPRAAYWRHLQLMLDVTSPRVETFQKFSCAAASPAKGLEWATTAIRQHPEAVARVQSELACVVGLDRFLVDESDIPKLPYLQAVVKELFRLHPPAPFSLPHELVASADASLQQVDEDGECSQLLGYDILQVPQTQVFINIYAVNRDPSVWERPNEFHPDRFLQHGPDDQNKLDLVGCKNDRFMLLPFGAGRRQCPGARLAILFVQLGLANQLHSWNRSSSSRIFTAAAARTSTYNRRGTL